MDDESEFFTLAGSLLAAGTGSVAYLTQQSKKKSKKRRRSEAADTDAAPNNAAGASVMEAAAEAAVTSARANAVPDGLPAKTKKAGKEHRKAAKQQSAHAAAQGQAVAGAHPKQVAADSFARLPESRGAAGKPGGYLLCLVACSVAYKCLYGIHCRDLGWMTPCSPVAKQFRLSTI